MLIEVLQPKTERAQVSLSWGQGAGGAEYQQGARAGGKPESPRPRSLLPQKISYFSFLKNMNTFTTAETHEKISAATKMAINILVDAYLSVSLSLGLCNFCLHDLSIEMYI